jgi:excisionase family DNA binding protein
MEPMSLKEAAEYAGVRPVTLRWAAENKRLEAQKVGRDWITTREAVDAYLAARPGGHDRKPYTRKEAPDADDA